MHTLEQLRNYEKQMRKQGYFILDCNTPSIIDDISLALEKKLKEVSGIADITLENYHEFYQEDNKHYDIQFKMLEFFRECQFAQQVISDNLDVYQFILGPDLEVQTSPYLRITRPMKNGDNIGFHRDTFYGTGPGEISTVIPFLELPKTRTLSVMPASHIIPDKEFKTTQVENKSAPKGSKRHQMGFLYAPKVMDESIKQHVVPIPLKKGQALVFMLSIIHGSEENRSSAPRWSTDVRVRNSLTPLNQDMKDGYYKSLKTSATSDAFVELTK